MEWELLEPESPNIKDEALRHLARTGVNVSTAIAGMPGDILSLINEFAAKPAYKAVSGKPGVSYNELGLSKILPTSRTLKKGAQSQFGEFVQPTNEIEKFTDEVIEDAASLINPAKGIGKISNLLLKPLAKSVGANLVGETVKQTTGSEEAGTYSKMGALFLGSILDRKGVAKQVGDLYKDAEASLPAGAKTKSIKLQNNLSKLENQVTKNRPYENLAPSEKFVVDHIKKVENLVKNGEISIEQAWAQKRSLNEDLAKLFEITPDKKGQQRARTLAKQINGYLSETIHDYGKTNPKFYQPFKKADEAYGVLARSNWATKWIEKNVRHSPLTHGLLHLFGGPLGTTVGTVAAPYQAGKLMFRIAKSPTLAKLYGKTLLSAGKQDAAVFNRYLQELDEKLQEEESIEKWEFLD